MEHLGHTQSTVYTYGPRITSGGTKSGSSFLPSVQNQACSSRHFMQQSVKSSMNADDETQNDGVTSAHRRGSARCRLHSACPPELNRKLATAEWTAWTRAELSAADRARSGSELVRADVVTACRGLCERTRRTQADATRRLGDRTNDIKFWRDEIRAEADAAGEASAALERAIGLLDRAYTEAEVPLQIAEECLHLREQRIGVDLVRDNVEIELIKEVEIFRKCREEMRQLVTEASNQALIIQNMLSELTKDAAEKQMALGMDRSAFKLRNTSRGLEFQDGVENFDNTVSNQDSWTQHSSDIITRSQKERAKAKEYQDLIDQMLCKTASEMTNQWNIVNAVFGDRIREYIKARTDLETHLRKVLQEIVELEKYCELLKRCIQEKEAPLKVAHTRLVTRISRPGVEACKDSAQYKLVEEVHEIGDTLEQLREKMLGVEKALHQLQQTRQTLEYDLSVKNNSIHVDRELCLSWRKSFDMSPRRSVYY